MVKLSTDQIVLMGRFPVLLPLYQINMRLVFGLRHSFRGLITLHILTCIQEH